MPRVISVGMFEADRVPAVYRQTDRLPRRHAAPRRATGRPPSRDQLPEKV